jgi:antitoxin component YwqK of YwqJK toxin-antitoxin module
VLLAPALCFFVNCGNAGGLKITHRYPNGNKSSGVVIAKDGATCRIYWKKNGLVREKRFTRDGKLVRRLTYNQGRLARESLFTGNKAAKKIWFYPDGSVSDIREYKNGKPHGRWAYWDKKGKLVDDVTYRNGKKVKSQK